MTVLRFSRETESMGYTYLLTEMVHVVMQAEKSHNLSAN